MAVNYYTNVKDVVVSDVAISDDYVVSVGYDVDDDLQSIRGQGSYQACVACGDRTREFTVTTRDVAEAYAAFIAPGGNPADPDADEDNTFTLTGASCLDGTTDEKIFDLGTTCMASTFSLSADGTSIVEPSVTVLLKNAPPAGLHS